MRFWMATAFCEPDHLVPLARAAERAGFHGITVSDHLVYPREISSTYPYTPDGSPGWQPETPWPDPWVTIGLLAGATERIHFTTNIYVAPARDLFTVAKAISSAAVLSGGRVSVGVAPGWCAEEFALTGQDFANRGRRLDEMVPLLRELWTDGWTEHRGEHFTFDELRISPVPAEPVPILVGGDTPVAMRRAARLGDGWIGTLYPPDEAEEKVSAMGAALDEQGRGDAPFEMLISLLAHDDLDLFRRFGDLGVTGIIHAPWMLAGPDLDARIAAVERFGEEIIAPLAS